MNALNPLYGLNVSLELADALALWSGYNVGNSGENFINNDFHLISTSMLHNKGRDPVDVVYWVYQDANYISPDFVGISRIIPPETTVTSFTFSVGPYEY